MNFEKFQLKWKIVKHFTRPKQQAALRRLFSLFQPPIPPDKILLRLWSKNFLREIYRNKQTFAFKVLQESSSWGSGNGAVQMFLLTPSRNMFPRKFENWESFLALFWEHIIFNFKRNEIRKMSVDFWAKLYCKMSDLFWWFSLALRFSATNSGKKKLWRYLKERVDWRCTPETVFWKKELQIWDFELFIFWSKFRFLGDCFRTF